MVLGPIHVGAFLMCKFYKFCVCAVEHARCNNKNSCGVCSGRRSNILVACAACVFGVDVTGKKKTAGHYIRDTQNVRS